MRIWRKESLSYYTSIWVGAREKIGDNVGTKVFNTHFNMFCRRVAELWFFVMFLRIEFLKNIEIWRFYWT